jgi:hypothetical protein
MGNGYGRGRRTAKSSSEREITLQEEEAEEEISDAENQVGANANATNTSLNTQPQNTPNMFCASSGLQCESSYFSVVHVGSSVVISDAMTGKKLWSKSLESTEGKIAQCNLNLEKPLLSVLTEEGTFVQIDISTGHEEALNIADEVFDSTTLFYAVSQQGTYFATNGYLFDRLTVWNVEKKSKALVLNGLRSVPRFSFDDRYFLNWDHPELHVWECETMTEFAVHIVSDPESSDDSRLMMLQPSFRDHFVIAMDVRFLDHEGCRILVIEYLTGSIIFSVEFEGKENYCCRACFGPTDETVILAQQRRISIYSVGANVLHRAFDVAQFTTNITFNYNRNTILAMTEDTRPRPDSYSLVEIDFDSGEIMARSPLLTGEESFATPRPVVVLM